MTAKKTKKTRKKPSNQTMKLLFASSGNRCAILECPFELVLTEKNIVLADMCHIEGEQPNSARYNPDQTEKERIATENLILLCKNHHWIIDHDLETYTVEYLKDLKQNHLKRMQTQPSPSPLTFEIFEQEIPNLIQYNAIYNQIKIGDKNLIQLLGDFYLNAEKSEIISEKKINKEFSKIIRFLLQVISDTYNYDRIRKLVHTLESLGAFAIRVNDNQKKIVINFEEIAYTLRIDEYEGGGGGYSYQFQDDKFQTFDAQIPQKFHRFLETLRNALMESQNILPDFPEEYNSLNFEYQIDNRTVGIVGGFGDRIYASPGTEINNFHIILINLSKTPIILKKLLFLGKIGDYTIPHNITINPSGKFESNKVSLRELQKNIPNSSSYQILAILGDGRKIRPEKCSNS